MTILWVDVESFSPLSLKTCGTAKYATQCEVMTLQWALGDGPVRVWDLTGEDLHSWEDLTGALQAASCIYAHNSYFDRTVLATTDWWPHELAPLSKWRCMMAQAFIHGLPGKLKALCEVFQVPAKFAKREGKDLIQLFCKPQGKKKTRATAQTHPTEWAEFLAYAGNDIEAMRYIYKVMPRWNYSALLKPEVELWHLDQLVNDRGVGADVHFAAHAVRATTKAKKGLAERTAEITDGMVGATTQRDRLLGYLCAEHGMVLPNLKADTLERLLDQPELPDMVKELLRIRLQASKASTSKYKRVIDMQVAGRLYGTLQYAAANRTGRWGGRGFQPQNQPRLSLDNVAAHWAIEKDQVAKWHIAQYLDQGIEAICSETEEMLF